MRLERKWRQVWLAACTSVIAILLEVKEAAPTSIWPRVMVLPGRRKECTEILPFLKPQPRKERSCCQGGLYLKLLAGFVLWRHISCQYAAAGTSLRL